MKKSWPGGCKNGPGTRQKKKEISEQMGWGKQKTMYHRQGTVMQMDQGVPRMLKKKKKKVAASE